MRIARTFQTPRIVGEASVLDNVMIGGTIDGQGTFAESLLSLPRHHRDEARLRESAMLALATVGLEQLAAVRADRLQHSELRFIEIARVSSRISRAASPQTGRPGCSGMTLGSSTMLIEGAPSSKDRP